MMPKKEKKKRRKHPKEKRCVEAKKDLLLRGETHNANIPFKKVLKPEKRDVFGGAAAHLPRKTARGQEHPSRERGPRFGRCTCDRSSDQIKIGTPKGRRGMPSPWREGHHGRVGVITNNVSAEKQTLGWNPCGKRKAIRKGYL